MSEDNWDTFKEAVQHMADRAAEYKASADRMNEIVQNMKKPPEDTGNKLAGLGLKAALNKVSPGLIQKLEKTFGIKLG